MIYKEANYIIDDITWSYGGKSITKDGIIECRETCHKALEKQIPRKPIENRYPWVICPACGGSVYIDKVQEHIRNNENTYCEHCGQALDWSDSE